MDEHIPSPSPSSASAASSQAASPYRPSSAQAP